MAALKMGTPANLAELGVSKAKTSEHKLRGNSNLFPSPKWKIPYSDMGSCSGQDVTVGMWLFRPQVPQV